MDPVRDRLGIDPFVRTIPDFPTPGVQFKDITPLLADPQQLRRVVRGLADGLDSGQVDAVVGIESRGFILGAPVALELDAAFVPARKAGKLPAATEAVTYDLEYGQATLELHTDAFAPGARVLVIDDVLATGGTAAATCELVRRCDGQVLALRFLIELSFLGGAAVLTDHDVTSLLVY